MCRSRSSRRSCSPRSRSRWSSQPDRAAPPDAETQVANPSIHRRCSIVWAATKLLLTEVSRVFLEDCPEPAGRRSAAPSRRATPIACGASAHALRGGRRQPLRAPSVRSGQHARTPPRSKRASTPPSWPLGVVAAQVRLRVMDALRREMERRVTRVPAPAPRCGARRKYSESQRCGHGDRTSSRALRTKIPVGRGPATRSRAARCGAALRTVVN